MVGIGFWSVRRFAPLLVLLVVPLLAGCGSDESQTSETKSSDRTPAGATEGKTSRKGPSAPRNTSSYAGLTRKSSGRTTGKISRGLFRGSAGGHVLRDAPTPLMEATYEDCLSTVEFFDEIAAFPEKIAACDAPAQEISTGSCLSRPIKAIAAKTRTAVETSKTVNRALDQRRISGLCYRAIGTSEEDLRNASRIASTADAFDEAIQADDPGRIKRATKDFQTALDDFSNSPSPNPEKLLRGCRPRPALRRRP